MNITVIANPISGGGKGEKKLCSYCSAMTNRGHNVSELVTEKAGDAQSFAGRINDNTDIVAIIGGDGTVTEVLNGLVEVDRFPLLSIPAGTANILSKELHIKGNAEKLADISERRDVIYADAGIAAFRNETDEMFVKRFLLVCSAGFDSWVTREVKQRRKGALGYSGYFVPILRSILNYNFPRLTVTVDGETSKGYMVVVGNTRNYGGLFCINPDADMESGSFEVCIFKKRGRISLALNTVRALLGKLGNSSGVQYISGREIEINCEREVPFQLDGDYTGQTPVKISMLPVKVPLLTGNPS